jgi:peptidyl-prolyl cis-trans isomerase C
MTPAGHEVEATVAAVGGGGLAAHSGAGSAAVGGGLAAAHGCRVVAAVGGGFVGGMLDGSFRVGAHGCSVVRALACAFALTCFAACGGGDHSGPADRHGSARPKGVDVVSSVDRDPITLQALQQLHDDSTLSIADALRRLQAERLLEAEADRRGYGSQPQTQQLARQALVQSLLARVVEVGTVSELEVDDAYARASTRFDRPERRAATHLLAHLPDKPSPAQLQAAHDFAEDACRRLQQASDLRTTLRELADTRSPAFTIKVEDLPPAPEQGAYVPEFAQALFSLPKSGIVPTPVRTQFGYHVIIVTAIIPPEHTAPELARATLRRELASDKHKAALADLLEGLGKHTPVQYSDKTQEALASLEF